MNTKMFFLLIASCAYVSATPIQTTAISTQQYNDVLKQEIMKFSDKVGRDNAAKIIEDMDSLMKDDDWWHRIAGHVIGGFFGDDKDSKALKSGISEDMDSLMKDDAWWHKFAGHVIRHGIRGVFGDDKDSKALKSGISENMDSLMKDDAWWHRFAGHVIRHGIRGVFGDDKLSNESMTNAEMGE